MSSPECSRNSQTSGGVVHGECDRAVALSALHLDSELAPVAPITRRFVGEAEPEIVAHAARLGQEEVVLLLAVDLDQLHAPVPATVQIGPNPALAVAQQQDGTARYGDGPDVAHTRDIVCVTCEHPVPRKQPLVLQPCKIVAGVDDVGQAFGLLDRPGQRFARIRADEVGERYGHGGISPSCGATIALSLGASQTGDSTRFTAGLP